MSKGPGKKDGKHRDLMVCCMGRRPYVALMINEHYCKIGIQQVTEYYAWTPIYTRKDAGCWDGKSIASIKIRAEAHS